MDVLIDAAMLEAMSISDDNPSGTVGGERVGDVESTATQKAEDGIGTEEKENNGGQRRSEHHRSRVRDAEFEPGKPLSQP